MRCRIGLAGLLVVLMAGCASDDSNAKLDAYENVPEASLFASSSKYLKHKQFAHAIEKLEALETHYPFGEHVEMAQLNLIYAYQQHNDFDEAYAAADRYLHLYPRSEHVPYALYMRAKSRLATSGSWLQKKLHTDAALRDMADYHKAYNDFKALSKDHPDSKYAGEAKQQMQVLRNIFAEHELHAARFYYDHDAFVAAANRASSLLKTYPQAPQTQATLELLYQSYSALQQTKLANDVKRVIQHNFPQSAVLKG